MTQFSSTLHFGDASIRFSRLLSLALWVGGITFFAFAVAPIAFGRLPAHEAGLVVGGTLRVLHLLGLACGLSFLVLTPVDLRRAGVRRRMRLECGLVLAMIFITAYSQFAVLPAMERYRSDAGGDISVANAANPARVAFEKLHSRSELIESAVLLTGLALLFAVATEAGSGDDRIVES